MHRDGSVTVKYHGLPKQRDIPLAMQTPSTIMLAQCSGDKPGVCVFVCVCVTCTARVVPQIVLGIMSWVGGAAGTLHNRTDAIKGPPMGQQKPKRLNPHPPCSQVGTRDQTHLAKGVASDGPAPVIQPTTDGMSQWGLVWVFAFFCGRGPLPLMLSVWGLSTNWQPCDQTMTLVVGSLLPS